MADETVFHAYTNKFETITNRLVSAAKVQCSDNSVDVNALWDTGATGTCISEGVARALKLIPTGKRNIQTPSGSKTVNTYLVDVVLPNNVIVKNVMVCDPAIGDQGIGMLVGMDIITQGDLSVSNYNGRTVFSFRTPSKKTTDFVAEITRDNLIGKPHGKGKRKHR